MLFKASLFFLNRFIYLLKQFFKEVIAGRFPVKKLYWDSKLEKFIEEKTKIFEFSIQRVLAYHFVKRSNLQLSLIHIKKSACRFVHFMISSKTIQRQKWSQRETPNRLEYHLPVKSPILNHCIQILAWLPDPGYHIP